MTRSGSSAANTSAPRERDRRSATPRLDGKRIAIGGPRRMKELSELVRNLGGEPLARPLMNTVPLEDPTVLDPLSRLAGGGADWVVLTTGVGTRSLVAAAERAGIRDAVLASIAHAKIAARGYKTVNALRELGLAPTVTDTDGSIEGLLTALGPHDIAGARTTVQLYGTNDSQLIDALRARGALVDELVLYRYTPPAGDVVAALLAEITAASIDAVVFTSAPQATYLFEAAKARGEGGAVRDAFNAGAPIALSQGAVTSAALREHGVTAIVAPENERMGAMIMALAQHYANSAAP